MATNPVSRHTALLSVPGILTFRREPRPYKNPKKLSHLPFPAATATTTTSSHVTSFTGALR
jgi:hypothetical protein